MSILTEVAKRVWRAVNRDQRGYTRVNLLTVAAAVQNQNAVSAYFTSKQK